MRTSTKAAMICMAALAVSADSCEDRAPAAQEKLTQARKAQQAADSVIFTENAEIDNIKRRLQLTADPGKLGFIVLLNQAGQPIMYEGVKGKVTSGGKRLTQPTRVVRWDCGAEHCDHEMTAPGDEGTYGTSGEYIYYWNVEGVYRQWSGDYLYSDQPIRLRVEPLVITAK